MAYYVVALHYFLFNRVVTIRFQSSNLKILTSLIMSSSISSFGSGENPFFTSFHSVNHNSLVSIDITRYY